MKATYSAPTGFRDMEPQGKPVEIVGYCWGSHIDALGYDRRGETVLAVFVCDGRFDYAPLSHLAPSNTETPT